MPCLTKSIIIGLTIILLEACLQVILPIGVSRINRDHATSGFGAIDIDLEGKNIIAMGEHVSEIWTLSYREVLGSRILPGE
jgi:hypothetical protein